MHDNSDTYIYSDAKSQNDLIIVVVALVSDVASGFFVLQPMSAFYYSNIMDNFVGTLYNLH